MKKIKIFSTVLLSVAILVPSFSTSVSAGEDDQKEKVVEVINNFGEALLAKDINKLDILTVDLRYPNEGEKKQNLETTLPLDGYVNFELNELTEKSKDLYEANIEVKDNNNEVVHADFPVVKENGSEWRVVIGQNVDSPKDINSISDYNSLMKKAEANQDSSNSLVNAAASSVKYYTFSFSSLSTTNGNSTWVNNNANPSISGWQEPTLGGSGAAISLRYYMVQVGSIFDSTLANKQFTGKYDQNGKWYSYTFSGMPVGKQLRLDISNSGEGVRGAGNVYN